MSYKRPKLKDYPRTSREPDLPWWVYVWYVAFGFFAFWAGYFAGEKH